MIILKCNTLRQSFKYAQVTFQKLNFESTIYNNVRNIFLAKVYKYMCSYYLKINLTKTIYIIIILENIYFI